MTIESAASRPITSQTVDAPPIINLANIQGNIFGGFNKDHQSFLFLSFTDPARSRDWVGHMIKEIATSQEVIAFNELFKTLKNRLGHDPTFLKTTWTNLAFTYRGMAALGLNNAELTTLPQAFQQGMRARAAVIGDVGDSGPSNWITPFNSSDTHAILMVASDSPEDLNDQVNAYVAAMTVNGAVELLYLQQGLVRTDQPGHEHFGFKDGVSQPGIRGVNQPDDPTNSNQGHRGQDLLWPGEFVLGYPTQIPTPVIPGTTDLNENPGPASTSGPAWTNDGSYLVFRRLRQNVPAFHHFVADEAHKLGLSQEVMGAKLVGRYASGAPLERTKDQAATFDPTGHDPSVADPSLLDESRINNFEYGNDQAGKIVPRAAHIRKAYPRDEIPPSESQTQTRRLLRRGIPFGTSFHPTPGVTTDTAYPNDRGLLFLAYQKNIEEQFEFVQNAWVNNPNFPQNADGQDPIIAQRDTKRNFTMPLHGGQSAHIKMMQHFVVTTGGEYFFQPSIKALYHIAGLIPPSV